MSVIDTERVEIQPDYNGVPQYQISQLGIIGKSPSPDFIPDEESASMCPLLTPSPTVVDFRHPLDSLTATLEKTMLLEGKSPSPDFIQDEETALLTSSSPPLTNFRHPLDPLSALSYERQNTPSSVDTEIMNLSRPVNGSEVQYVELEQARENRSASVEEAQESFPAQARNSVPSELLESSASSSSFALQENTSCVQLLGNHHYQHLNMDKMNDVAAFITQENCSKQPVLDITDMKSPPDYCFLSWNWPLIRKSCFWSVMSIVVGCFCIVVAMVATVPRKCYPSHYWYQGSVFYEIFPASFQDSDHDGVGDLRGIASRAEYLQTLGISAIRLNSIFSASHYPEGYNDIKNLTEIEKSLGHLDSFNYLMHVMHSKNISIILDFPLYPYIKELGELKVSAARKSGRKDVADKITNVVNNHRSHRSADNETTHVPVRNLVRDEFSGKKMMLKPYIDGGIAGLMKYTSEHLNSISQTIVEEALYYWFDLGVKGVYLKGLENYVNDPKFLSELRKWKNIKDSYRAQGDIKMLMCDIKVLDSVEDEEEILTILDTMDLLDVHLEISNGTSSIESQILRSRLYNQRNYPWLHWNIGNVNITRLSSRVEKHLGAILFQFLLPGTISIFYGDEIGLHQVRSLDHSDMKHVYQLSPMRWSANGTRFTRIDHLPWLPLARAEKNVNWFGSVISNMTRLRKETPSIYMNSVWKDNKSISNYAIRYRDKNIIVLERSYPRRNSYIVLYNVGQSRVEIDLSTIYYGGELMEDINGNSEQYITFNNFTLAAGGAYIVKLD